MDLINSWSSWQRGYGTFSYSKSQFPHVTHYIKTQREHHLRKTFFDEYHELPDELEIEFDKKYLFKPVDF